MESVDHGAPTAGPDEPLRVEQMDTAISDLQASMADGPNMLTIESAT